VQVTWDDDKATANLAKHGIPFEQAALVFQDPQAVHLFDDQHSLHEDRWTTIGLAGALLLLVRVTWTEREDTARIISARRADAHDRARYLEG
jgi:uncharacterized DUF497 family protein